MKENFRIMTLTQGGNPNWVKRGRDAGSEAFLRVLPLFFSPRDDECDAERRHRIYGGRWQRTEEDGGLRRALGEMALETRSNPRESPKPYITSASQLAFTSA